MYTYPNKKANERKKCEAKKDIGEEYWRPLLRLSEDVGYFRLRSKPSIHFHWYCRWWGCAFRSFWQVQI
jgi:hypothetical protein